MKNNRYNKSFIFAGAISGALLMFIFGPLYLADMFYKMPLTAIILTIVAAIMIFIYTFTIERVYTWQDLLLWLSIFAYAYPVFKKYNILGDYWIFIDFMFVLIGLIVGCFFGFIIGGIVYMVKAIFITLRNRKD